MRATISYWMLYYRNMLFDQRRKLNHYGVRAFLPHVHVPNRIPAGDGWYCRTCGTRNYTVQKRGCNGRTAGRNR